MSRANAISDEQLNAYVDQQLDHEDRERVLGATIRDQRLAEEVFALFQMKELVQQAYREPPGSFRNPVRRSRRFLPWVAVFIVAMFTGLGGYYSHSGGNYVSNTFYDHRQIRPAALAGKRVLLHVDSNDPNRAQQAMQIVRRLLAEHPPEQIEVIANGAGLAMVRAGSAQADTVHSLTSHYANVKFRACGFAMEATRLKEGRPVVLLPEVKKVDAALNEILRRLQEGWVYIKV